jgi:hypothetical protein
MVVALSFALASAFIAVFFAALITAPPALLLV